MKDRIKKIRKDAGLNQEEFGQKIGVKQSSVTAYECGYRNPIDAVIKTICDTFNVNREWLLTGEGEPYQEVEPYNQVVAFVADAFKGKPDVRQHVLNILSQMDDREWEVIEGLLDKILEEYKEKDG